MINDTIWPRLGCPIEQLNHFLKLDSGPGILFLYQITVCSFYIEIVK